MPQSKAIWTPATLASTHTWSDSEYASPSTFRLTQQRGGFYLDGIKPFRHKSRAIIAIKGAGWLRHTEEEIAHQERIGQRECESKSEDNGQQH